jgi:uncharacterized protein YukE
VGFEEWPEEDAQRIKEVATAVEMPDGIELVDRMKNIIAGDAALVESYAEIWVPKSVDELTERQDTFNALVTRVNDVWTGTAADEFKAWAVKYNTAINECKTAMNGPFDTLWKCSAEITKTYSAAVKMIGRIAAKIVEITSDIVNIPLFALAELGELIQLFITEATTLLGDALERMQGYREAMSRMRGAVAELAQLVPMGHVVGDPAGWQPRPAAG